MGNFVLDFGLIGRLKIGNQIRETHNRFKNINGYGSFINSIDQDYESEDSVFNGDIYKFNTPDFRMVNISRYGNGCDFKHEIIENQGKISFFSTKGNCFIKCLNCLTGRCYEQEVFDFIRTEDRRTNIKRRALFQPCFKTLGIVLDFYSGKNKFRRIISERNKE